MKLTINDKEYGLQWGMGAIIIYCDTLDCDIEGLDKAITSPTEIERVKAITTLILSAIQNWCEIPENHTDFDLTYKKLEIWLDEAPQDEYNAILANWKASKIHGKTIGQIYFNELPISDSKKKTRSASRK